LQVAAQVGAVGVLCLVAAVVASGRWTAPTSLQAERAARTRSGAAPGTREKLASWGQDALNELGSWEGLSPVAANPQPVLHSGGAQAQQRAGAAPAGSDHQDRKRAAQRGAAADGAQLALSGPTLDSAASSERGSVQTPEEAQNLGYMRTHIVRAPYIEGIFSMHGQTEDVTARELFELRKAIAAVVHGAAIDQAVHAASPVVQHMVRTERILIELVMWDRKIKASREGLK